MENLRYILSQYRHQTALLIGHRYIIEETTESCMAGGGYILSKKALSKFIKLVKEEKCRNDPGGAEDVEMGKCLTNHAIFLDGNDQLGQNQFFPIGIEEHVKDPKHYTYWYRRIQWSNYTEGSLDCCADTIASLHYINPEQMYLLNYLIYNVHPFGLTFNKEMPKKLSLQEVINLSEVKSMSKLYKEHPLIHHLDDDERY